MSQPPGSFNLTAANASSLYPQPPALAGAKFPVASAAGPSAVDVFTPKNESDEKEEKNQNKLTHQQKDRGLMILGGVKTLLGGLIVGGAVATVEKVRFWPMVGIDMLLGVGETLLAKWVIEAKDPASKKVLGFSSRVSKAPDIPVEQMSHAEREQALTPISVLVSGLSALLTLGVADRLKNSPKMQRPAVTPVEVGNAKGLSRGVKRLQAFLQQMQHQLKAPAWLAKNKLYKITLGTKIAKVLLPAMAVGLLEGLVTQKLIKDEKKQNSLYHKILTLLRFE